MHKIYAAIKSETIIHKSPKTISDNDRPIVTIDRKPPTHPTQKIKREKENPQVLLTTTQQRSVDGDKYSHFSMKCHKNKPTTDIPKQPRTPRVSEIKHPLPSKL